jgi:hypothetical protein
MGKLTAEIVSFSRKSLLEAIVNLIYLKIELNSVKTKNTLRTMAIKKAPNVC